MKVLAFVLLTIIVCCSQLGAVNIYTAGSGDGYINYSYGTNNPATYSLDTSSQTLYASHCYAEYTPTPNPFWVIESYSDTTAVLIFPISSLKGYSIPDGGVILHYNSQANILSGMLSWGHFTQDIGPSVTVGCYTTARELIDSTIRGTDNWTWSTLNVTQWVKNDISNGFNYSAFSVSGFASTNDCISGQIQSSESGNGAYLSVIPEPASIINLICSLGGLGCFIRRKMI